MYVCSRRTSAASRPFSIEPVGRPCPAPRRRAGPPRPPGCFSSREQVLVGDRRTGLPLGLDRGQCARGQDLAGRGDADEIAVVDHDHVGHRLGRAGVDRGQRRAVATEDAGPCRATCRAAGCPRRTGACRSRTPAIDLRHRVAGDGPLLRRAWSALVGDGLRELAALGQLAVRERLLGLGVDDGTIGRRQQRCGRPSRSRPRGR